MRRLRRTFTVLAGAAFIVGGLTAPGIASADDSPTVRELLDQCEQGKTDVCEFHPSGSPEAHRGEYELAGGAQNCSEGTSTRVIRWESTQTTTNSVGVTINAGVKLGEIFEAGYEASFNQEWSWSTTQADEIRHELGPYQGVDIYTAPMRESVTGTYELHFGDPYYGHYYWYVNDVVVDGPALQPAWDVRVDGTTPAC